MIARATVEDKASPITYGYDDSVGVYFNQGPVFSVSVAGRFGRFFADDSGGSRPSGRGSMTDPDIPQGRAWTEPEAPVHRSKAEQELYVNPELRVGLELVSSAAVALPARCAALRWRKRLANQRDARGRLGAGGIAGNRRRAGRQGARRTVRYEPHVAAGDAGKLYVAAQRRAELRPLERGEENPSTGKTKGCGCRQRKP